jgi:hypothetical protein
MYGEAEKPNPAESHAIHDIEAMDQCEIVLIVHELIEKIKPK